MLLCGIFEKTSFSPVIYCACVHRTHASLASVGLAQAHPNKSFTVLKVFAIRISMSVCLECFQL